MKTYSLAMLGFGNVGRAFVRLLMKKEGELAGRYGLAFNVTGIATGRHGNAIDPAGIDLARALELGERGLPLDPLSAQPAPANKIDFIYACPGQAMLENSPVNAISGEPAVSHIRAALKKGMHAITANKGPVVHAHRELTDLAGRNGKRFLFESAVMDGAPIFSLFRGPLPAVELRSFTGILNSCTNLLIGLMEEGRDFNDAVTYAQSIGIAETDPSADIDGWDASIKVAALCTVLMGIPLKPQQVNRRGIREITPALIAEARAAGQRWKLVCRAQRTGEDTVSASVQPQRVGPETALYAINGTSSYVQFELDVLPGLGIVESNPGPDTTAYGLLADLINAYRGG